MKQQEKADNESRALALVRWGCEESPFNRLLGLRVDHISAEQAWIRFQPKPELVDNLHQNTLHGGVIAAVLDAVGGTAACASALLRTRGIAEDEIMRRMAGLRTIDLRVDYLRPGKGKEFLCVGTVLRAGRRVAVTRMELFDDEDKLIAAGTGAYLVG